MWQVTTTIIVLLFLLNPELAQVGLFIDAVGLELFMMMLEVQLLAVIAIFLSSSIKPLIQIYRRLTEVMSSSHFRYTPMLAVLLLPSPAILMHSLVISSAIYMANS